MAHFPILDKPYSRLESARCRLNVEITTCYIVEQRVEDGTSIIMGLAPLAVREIREDTINR